MTALKIPYDQLNPETLHGVIEEFATRDGTVYEIKANGLEYLLKNKSIIREKNN